MRLSHSRPRTAPVSAFRSRPDAHSLGCKLGPWHLAAAWRQSPENGPVRHGGVGRGELCRSCRRHIARRNHRRGHPPPPKSGHRRGYGHPQPSGGFAAALRPSNSRANRLPVDYDTLLPKGRAPDPLSPLGPRVRSRLWPARRTCGDPSSHRPLRLPFWSNRQQSVQVAVGWASAALVAVTERRMG